MEEAVLEQRGETPKVQAECAADLAVAASIPDRYVPSPEQRMDLYRRIARIRSAKRRPTTWWMSSSTATEIPRTVNNLISVALLRAAAAGCGITEIAQKGERLNFTLAQVDFAKVSSLCGGAAYRGRLLFSAGEKPYLALKVRKGEDALKLAARLVEEYRATPLPSPQNSPCRLTLRSAASKLPLYWSIPIRAYMQTIFCFLSSGSADQNIRQLSSAIYHKV